MAGLQGLQGSCCEHALMSLLGYASCTLPLSPSLPFLPEVLSFRRPSHPG